MAKKIIGNVPTGPEFFSGCCPISRDLGSIYAFAVKPKRLPATPSRSATHICYACPGWWARWFGVKSCEQISVTQQKSSEIPGTLSVPARGPIFLDHSFG